MAVAAVGDYRCQTIAAEKIHKQEAVTQLTLERNPDIVASVGQLTQKPFIVGFAAETEDVIAQAKVKRQRKNMDMIIANHVGNGLAMGKDENTVIVIGSQNEELTLPLAAKNKLARELIAMIAVNYKKTGKST